MAESKGLTLREIAHAIRGRLIGGDAEVSHFTQDSREARKGSLFFAIRGERFDGHDFVRGAFERGAVAAVVERIPEGVEGSFILVDDTIAALQRLAGYYREKYLKETRIIAIGGAAGKTTTKEMMHRVLSSKYRTYRSPKSYNNHIGVPLTLLNTPSDARYLILEVGTNHPGEIKSLVDIARNDYGLLTNIGPEHIEFFGSEEAIAREESHIFLHAEAGFARKEDIEKFGKHMILPPQIHHPRSLIEALQEAERREVGVVFRGIYFPNVAWLENALLVEVAGRFFGIENPMEHLRNFKSESMRMEMLKIGNLEVINDAYNSNPLSLRALFMSIRPSKANLFVLGDMLELGDYSEYYHRQMAREMVEMGHREAVLIGKHMRHFFDEIKDRAEVDYFETVEEAISRIKERLRGKRRLILKGSRGIGLERILHHL